MSTKYSGNSIPKWLNLSRVVEAAKNTLSKTATALSLTKVAASDNVIVNYRDSRGHLFSAEDPFIRSQIAKGGSLVGRDGLPLKVHKVVKAYAKPEDTHVQTVSRVKRVAKSQNSIHPSYMTDSTINRHIQYKALQALTNFANACGMYGARAKYLTAKNASMEGKHFQGFKEVTAEISWMVGPRLRKNVTATIGIDVGNKFIYPSTFKTVEGTEYPFTKEAVGEILKGMEYTKPTREVRKRSDVPTFKRPDPTRFQAIPK